MTLPGIAGFILTIGMGVDSNVLIFERIQEELATAKGARAAVAAGFDRVFLTILDTHVASLIAAAFLFQFGTGPIRGFATTLFFGLLANVFTAVFVSRTLFEFVLVAPAGARIEHLGRLHAMRIFTNPNFNSSVALARDRAVAASSSSPASALIATRRPAARHRLLGRHDRRRAVRAAGDRGRRARRPRALPGEKVVQQYGDRGEQRDPGPAAAGRRQPSRAPPRAGRARRSQAALRQGRPRRVRDHRAARSSARSSARTCSARASTRRCVARRHHGLHRAALPLQLRASAPIARRPRRPRRRWRS